MSEPVTITVSGRPAPQGSKRAFAIRRGGQLTGQVAMAESSKAVRPWRDAIRSETQRAMSGRQPLDGPLTVAIILTLPKPVSAPKRTRTWPCRKPDLDKLARSVLDGLTEGGAWHDDAQVTEFTRLAKVFPGEDPEALAAPGARITIRQVTG
jgi:Holliday junction resolvase RusA-like endonuclease